MADSGRRIQTIAAIVRPVPYAQGLETNPARDNNPVHLGQTAKALADDLPLFAVPSRAAAEAAPPSEAEQMMEAVKALHPDEMSPREALEALYALKAKLPKG